MTWIYINQQENQILLYTQNYFLLITDYYKNQSTTNSSSTSKEDKTPLKLTDVIGKDFTVQTDNEESNADK